MMAPAWVSSGLGEGVRAVVWERDVAARGWLSGGEPEEEVAAGGVCVWAQVVGELGFVCARGNELWAELVGAWRCWGLHRCLQDSEREFWWV